MDEVTASGRYHTARAQRVHREEGWATWNVEIQQGRPDVWMAHRPRRGTLVVTFPPQGIVPAGTALLLYRRGGQSADVPDECWRVRLGAPKERVMQQVGGQEGEASVLADLILQILPMEARLSGYA